MERLLERLLRGQLGGRLLPGQLLRERLLREQGLLLERLLRPGLLLATMLLLLGCLPPHPPPWPHETQFCVPKSPAAVSRWVSFRGRQEAFARSS